MSLARRKIPFSQISHVSMMLVDFFLFRFRSTGAYDTYDSTIHRIREKWMRKRSEEIKQQGQLTTRFSIQFFFSSFYSWEVNNFTFLSIALTNNSTHFANCAHRNDMRYELTE